MVAPFVLFLVIALYGVVTAAWQSFDSSSVAPASVPVPFNGYMTTSVLKRGSWLRTRKKEPARRPALRKILSLLRQLLDDLRKRRRVALHDLDAMQRCAGCLLRGQPLARAAQVTGLGNVAHLVDHPWRYRGGGGLGVARVPRLFDLCDFIAKAIAGELGGVESSHPAGVKGQAAGLSSLRPFHAP